MTDWVVGVDMAGQHQLRLAEGDLPMDQCSFCLPQGFSAGGPRFEGSAAGPASADLTYSSLQVCMLVICFDCNVLEKLACYVALYNKVRHTCHLPSSSRPYLGYIHPSPVSILFQGISRATRGSKVVLDASSLCHPAPQAFWHGIVWMDSTIRICIASQHLRIME